MMINNFIMKTMKSSREVHTNDNQGLRIFSSYLSFSLCSMAPWRLAPGAECQSTITTMGVYVCNDCLPK
jgi:hypothetical protein